MPEGCRNDSHDARNSRLRESLGDHRRSRSSVECADIRAHARRRRDELRWRRYQRLDQKRASLLWNRRRICRNTWFASIGRIVFQPRGDHLHERSASHMDACSAGCHSTGQHRDTLHDPNKLPAWRLDQPIAWRMHPPPGQRYGDAGGGQGAIPATPLQFPTGPAAPGAGDDRDHLGSG